MLYSRDKAILLMIVIRYADLAIDISCFVFCYDIGITFIFMDFLGLLTRADCPESLFLCLASIIFPAHIEITKSAIEFTIGAEFADMTALIFPNITPLYSALKIL